MATAKADTYSSVIQRIVMITCCGSSLSRLCSKRTATKRNSLHIWIVMRAHLRVRARRMAALQLHARAVPRNRNKLVLENQISQR